MTRYIVAAMITLIVVAHVFLWRSGMETSLKLTFTIINATAWTIILGPIFFIDKWIKAIKTRNAADKDAR
jgi:hypothetical protein